MCTTAILHTRLSQMTCQHTFLHCVLLTQSSQIASCSQCLPLHVYVFIHMHVFAHAAHYLSVEIPPM